MIGGGGANRASQPGRALPRPAGTRGQLLVGLAAAAAALAVALTCWALAAGAFRAHSFGASPHVDAVLTINGKALILAASHTQAMLVLAAVPLSVLVAVLLIYWVGGQSDGQAKPLLPQREWLPVPHRAVVLGRVLAALLAVPAVMVAVSATMVVATMLLKTILFAFDVTTLVEPLFLTPDLYVAPLKALGLASAGSPWVRA